MEKCKEVISDNESLEELLVEIKGDIMKTICFQEKRIKFSKKSVQFQKESIELGKKTITCLNEQCHDQNTASISQAETSSMFSKSNRGSTVREGKEEDCQNSRLSVELCK